MADSKPLTAITITTATPKIREFVPKGEWREEGLGHYDPLSSHEIDGVRKEKERLTAVHACRKVLRVLPSGRWLPRNQG